MDVGTNSRYSIWYMSIARWQVWILAIPRVSRTAIVFTMMVYQLSFRQSPLQRRHRWYKRSSYQMLASQARAFPASLLSNSTTCRLCFRSLTCLTTISAPKLQTWSSVSFRTWLASTYPTLRWALEVRSRLHSSWRQLTRRTRSTLYASLIFHSIPLVQVASWSSSRGSKSPQC